MENLKQIIEAILFVSGEGISLINISEKLNIGLDELKNIVDEMIEEKDKNQCGIKLIKYNDKIQLCSNSIYKSQIEEVLNPIKEKMLTKKVLEVCSIIAYKQPITRLEIDDIRGMNSDYSVDILLDNNLIEIVGRKDTVGKPLLFGTTDNFLKKFGISSIEDLPDYNELMERIKVIKEKKDLSLFDYTEYSDNESIVSSKTSENLKQENDQQDNLTDKEQDEILSAIKDLDGKLNTYEIDISDNDKFV